MHNPIVVVQHINRVLETILQGARLEQCSGFRFVIFRHDNFTNASMLCQIDGLIGDHFDEKIFETGVEAGVHVAIDIHLDQIAEITASHNSYADEWGQ